MCYAASLAKFLVHVCNVSKGQQVCKTAELGTSNRIPIFRYSEIPIEYWIGEFKKLSAIGLRKNYRLPTSE